MTTKAMVALEKGLREDDPGLVQGSTALPLDRPTKPCGACGISYAGWKGDGIDNVGEVIDYFNTMCRAANDNLDEMAVNNHLWFDKTPHAEHFLKWFDTTPRDEMRAQLLPEVELAIAERELMGFRSTARSSAVVELRGKDRRLM